MDNIIAWVLIGILGAIILGFVIYKAVSIFKMSPEERKKVLVNYLVGLVNAAEGFIGSGHGKEKLEQVEKWFKEKAPLTYKILLSLLGKDNLEALIEEALKQIKENFEK